MGPELEKAMQELTLRMRMIRAMQEDQANEDALTERDSLILQLLAEQGAMSVTQIAESWPNVSESTISMTITKLWRKRGLVTKTIKPENQRVTLIELSDKGRAELGAVFKQRSERFQALFKALDMKPEEKQMLTNICQRGVKYFDDMLGLQKASDTD